MDSAIFDAASSLEFGGSGTLAVGSVLLNSGLSFNGTSGTGPVEFSLVHLGTVVGLMKIHSNYAAFEQQLDQIAPVYPEVPGLFDDPADWEAEGSTAIATVPK